MTYTNGQRKHGKGAKGTGKGQGKSLPNKLRNASWGSWQQKPSPLERKLQSQHDKALHQLALASEKVPMQAPRPKSKAKAKQGGKQPRSNQLTMEWRPFGALVGVVPVEQFHHRLEEIRGYQVEESSYVGLNDLIIYFAPGNACGCVRTTPVGAHLFADYNRETGNVTWQGPDVHNEGAPSGSITSTEVEPYPDLLLSNQVRILRSAFRIKIVFPPQAMLTFNWIHMTDGDYSLHANQLLDKYKHSPYRNRVTMKSNTWVSLKAPIRDPYEMRKWKTQSIHPSTADPLIASFCWLSEVSAPSTDWIAAPVVHLEFVSYIDCRLDPSMKHHSNVKPGAKYGKEPSGGGVG